MRLFLGIDGGQSSTKALIGDESGRVLGSAAGGPCNHASAEEGRARLERGLRGSLNSACEAAGIDPRGARFEAACIGMSGGPEDKREIIERIILAKSVIVTTDALIALAGATETGRGIVVIAGTGSIAWGRNGGGRSARAGGWGHVFGDEGGAFDIVRQAVRAALRMEEGWGASTGLRAALLEATGQPDANAVLHLFYADAWPRNRVATLATLVDEAAQRRDEVAEGILRDAAGSLAALAVAVRAQLWEPGEPVDIAYCGGVFRSHTVAARFRDLAETTPGARVAPPLHSPAEGALLEAWRAAGLTPSIRPAQTPSL